MPIRPLRQNGGNFTTATGTFYGISARICGVLRRFNSGMAYGQNSVGNSRSRNDAMGKVSMRSSGVSTRSCVAGSSTSNMPIVRRCKASMGGYACGCAASCVKGAGGRDEDAAQIINAGQTPISQSAGCSPVLQHVRKPSVRENGKTINWRAVCGRSACTVRREGKRSIRFPYPYHSSD